MKTPVYERFISSLVRSLKLKASRHPPSFVDAIENFAPLVPLLSLQQRKALITFARTGEPTDDFSPNIQPIKQLFVNKQWQMIRSFDTPLKRSLLLCLSRNSPITYQQEKEQLHEAAMKEYNIITSPPPCSRINYSVLFSRNMNTPIVPEVDINPVMSLYVSRALEQWVTKIKHTGTLYPKLSTKTVSHDTRSRCESYGVIDTHGISSQITQVDLERIYHYYNLKIGGVNEMRKVYYPSQFGIRIYYASGGDSFHKTKYIGKLMSWLCEVLVPSSRETRNLPNRLAVDDDEYALCYDFSSYTSNLWEHSTMLYHLFRSVEDIDVSIMDAHDGIVLISLRDILSDLFESHCRPLIQIREYIFGCVMPIICNEVAGLLGIIGNIPTAIFLHAAVVLQFVNATSKLNTPGDDGVLITNREKELYALCYMSLLGTFQMSKVYRTSDSGCLHLKKSIVQVYNKLITLPNVYFPSFEYVLSDEDIDHRYISAIKRMNKLERRIATSSSITSYLKSLRSVDLSDSDRLLSTNILSMLYEWNRLPVDGCVPQFMNHTAEYFCCIKPDEEYNYLGCPIEYTIRNQYTQIAKLVKRDIVEPLTDLQVVRKGELFQSNGSKLLTYLVQLGYLERSVVTELVAGLDIYERTIYEYTHYHPVTVYEYFVCKDMPYTMVSLDYIV